MMNSKNNLENWDLIENSNSERDEFFFEKINDTRKALEIILIDKNNVKLVIRWNREDVISYRNTYESYFSYGAYTKNQTLKKNFYQVMNSDYIHQIQNWSYPDVIKNISELSHYGIYTAEDCIDVVATSEPKISYN